MHCDPSLEPSRRDGINDGSQFMIYAKIREIIPVTPPYLEHWCVCGVGVGRFIPFLSLDAANLISPITSPALQH